MNKWKTSILTILFLLFYSTSTSAQSKIIDNIHHTNFYGIFEINHHGYLLSYEKKRKTYIEIYDEDLELVSSEITDLKISDHTKLAVRTNDEHFLLIMSSGSSQDKNKYKLVTYDFNGKKKKLIDLKAAIQNVVCAKNNKGFFVVVTEKGKTRIKFFDNELNMKWDRIVLNKSIIRSANDLFLPYSVEGYVSKNYAVTDEGLYYILTRPKGGLGLKLTDQKIIGISTEGSKIFEKEYDKKTERVLKIEAIGDQVLAFSLQGSFSRALSPKVDKQVIEFLNTEEEENGISDIKYFQEMVGRCPKYIHRDFYKKGNEYIFVLEDTANPRYLVLRFDLEFNLLYEEEEIFYNKSECVIHEWALLGSSSLGRYLDAMFHLNDYQFSAFTRDDELLIVYFQHNVRKRTVNLNVSSALDGDTDGKSIFDNINDDAKTSDGKVEVVSYFILQNEYNNGLYCYLNKNKSQIEMHIIEF